jgi:hypothetical protein
MKLFNGDVATEETLKLPWKGHRDGRWFRCYLCGEKFKVGDGFRAINSNYSGSPFTGNPLVHNPPCESLTDIEILKRLAERERATPWWVRLDLEETMLIRLTHNE